jgi:hypothetical protein
MSAAFSAYRSPRFCPQCGAALTLSDAVFCMACGHPIAPSAAPETSPDNTTGNPAVTGPTVRLPNARVAQSVVGGTMKLPSSGATPPGLWFLPEPPGPDDVIAIYAPLRAVVGGWSGTTSDGWQKFDQEWVKDGTSRMLVSFTVEREWFPAPGCAGDLCLRIRLRSTSLAQEGHTRHGFRYRIGSDSPMSVLEARWVDATAQPRPDLPLPQIQIMAPPRVQRISDYADEAIGQMHPREAEMWVQRGVVHGLFRLPNTFQQRTPVGRGLPLIEVGGSGVGRRLVGLFHRLYRVQLHNPLICRAGTWEALQPRIQQEARTLGLDIETDAMIEWWLDRQGYDSALFEPKAHRYDNGRQRVVIAFRRSQIVEVRG